MDLMSLVSVVVTYLPICCPSVVAQSEGVVEVPGGVTDSTGKVLYLSGAQCGVVAVDAESGNVLWQSRDGSRPLALVEDRLAVLSARPEPGVGNAMRVRYLDVEDNGARVGESDPVILPGVRVGDGRDHHGGGTLFRLRASRVGNDLHLHWSAGSYPYGGVRGAGSPRSTAGVAKVDLRTGKVELRTAEKEEEAQSAKGPTASEQLPPLVKELAAREKWQSAHVVGGRAYGQVDVSTAHDRVVHMIQAVDIESGQLLWQRPIGERLTGMPPP